MALTVGPKGEAAWSALTEALGEVVPACADDNRYVMEPAELPEVDLVQMRRACLGCPLLAECQAFAKITRPTGGFWAGRHYPLRHSRQDVRERAGADDTADSAPRRPGLNKTLDRVSEHLATIEAAADGRTALAASTRGTTT